MDLFGDFLHTVFLPLVKEHGALIVGCVVALESMGVPAPGESAVIAASLLAGSTHEIGIVPIVLAAAIGAVMGDNIGYLVGHSLGVRMLARYGGKIGLTEDRLLIGRYLFHRWGGQVVFFGRFIALLRTVAALLAGAVGMEWKRFLFWNALGAIVWSAAYGFGAYFLGHEIKRLAGPVGIGLGVAAAVVIIGSIVFIKRHEATLLEKAKEDAARHDAAKAARKAHRDGAGHANVALERSVDGE